MTHGCGSEPLPVLVVSIGEEVDSVLHAGSRTGVAVGAWQRDPAVHRLTVEAARQGGLQMQRTRFNPFTAPASKVSGLKRVRKCLQTAYFLML